MTQNRRMFMQSLPVFCLEGALLPIMLSNNKWIQEPAVDLLQSELIGTWKLISYTYTSNGRTYTSPDEMEGLVKFEEGEEESKYEVTFSTHISSIGVKRTRNSSESGTFSVTDNRIRLFAEEASSESEKGEEFLTEVLIKEDKMTLTSNNSSNKEIWERIKPTVPPPS